MSDGQKMNLTTVSNGKATKEEVEEPQTPIETIVIDPDATIVELTACRLRNIEGLDGLTKVETLNLRQNLIENIENLDPLITLTHLDLYDNHIERIEGLDALTQLKHLDLSFSMFIEEEKKTFRRILRFVSVDKISKIENLSNLVSLTSCFLVHNQLRTVENLSTLVNLRVLELGDNRIKVRSFQRNLHE